MKKILVISLLLIIVGCNKVEDVELTFKDNKVPVGEKISSCSLVNKVNGIEVLSTMITNDKIKIDDIEVICGDLDTSSIGTKDVTYKVNNKEYNLGVRVADEIAPVIDAKDEYSYYLNDDSIDLDKEIIVSDNYDKDIEYALDGKIDIGKVGTYDVNIIAKDSSGNKTEKTIKIHILAPISNNQSNTKESNEEKELKEDDLVFGGYFEVDEDLVDEPFVEGLENQLVKVGTTAEDFIKDISKEIISSSPINVDLSKVKLNVPGTYVVTVNGEDGASAWCYVKVEE